MIEGMGRTVGRQLRGLQMGVDLGREVGGLGSLMATAGSMRVRRALAELEVEQARIEIRRRELQVEEAESIVAGVARAVGASETWGDINVAKLKADVDQARVDLQRHEISLRALDVEARDQAMGLVREDCQAINRAQEAERESWQGERTAHVLQPDAAQ